MINRVRFRKFKQFSDCEIPLQAGLTLVAGGNNSGKSSLLQGLAIWEFCRTATIMERGVEGLLPEATSKQGFGLGDDEFSPINVPSLHHLWTNLKTQKTPEDSDGYTLRISCEWDNDKELEFGLALANDRLFIRTTNSNLSPSDKIPTVAYLPPFAGITSREERIRGAIRRRRIGEGLAGAVLRNLVLDMQQANLQKRSELRGERGKIGDADLRRLRAEDPWELLQQTIRTVFATELIVDEFRDDYHSYIKVEVVKGEVEGHQLRRHPGYKRRDLMVEGSGFLQWLSVYTLATTREIDVLLFDEPDAHLHSALQRQLLEHLTELAKISEKQVLLATHSSEILKESRPSRILQISSGAKTRYLSEEHQKIGLLEGIGSDYAPRVDQVRAKRRVLFHEGSSDIAILKEFARIYGTELPERWVEWPTTAAHKERRKLWLALRDDFPDVVAFSLRDRDDEPLGTVGENLVDKNEQSVEDFHPRKWRRRYIESYLIWPPALALASGRDEEDIRKFLQESHGVAVGATFTATDAPQALLDIRAKEVLRDLDLTAIEVARQMTQDSICADVLSVLVQLNDLAQ